MSSHHTQTVTHALSGWENRSFEPVTIAATAVFVGWQIWLTDDTPGTAINSLSVENLTNPLRVAAPGFVALLAADQRQHWLLGGWYRRIVEIETVGYVTRTYGSSGFPVLVGLKSWHDKELDLSYDDIYIQQACPVSPDKHLSQSITDDEIQSPIADRWLCFLLDLERQTAW